MKKGLLLLFALIYFIITVVLLTLPGSAFPKERFLDKIFFDKWVHIGLFTILVFLWNFWLIKKKNSAPGLTSKFIVVSILALAYGIAMEFVQKYWVPHRSFDVTDMVADGVGCLIGLFLSFYIYKKIDPCGNRGRNQN
ncbi:MAG TPA: VanZ family protein [Niabella sp.]